MKKKTKKTIIYILTLIFLLCVLSCLTYFYLQNPADEGDIELASDENYAMDDDDVLHGNETLLGDILHGDDEIPVCSGNEHGKTHEIIKHDYYTLCYCEKFEQPEWVAYELSQSELEKIGFKSVGKMC